MADQMTRSSSDNNSYWGNFDLNRPERKALATMSNEELRAGITNLGIQGFSARPTPKYGSVTLFYEPTHCWKGSAPQLDLRTCGKTQPCGHPCLDLLADERPECSPCRIAVTVKRDCDHETTLFCSSQPPKSVCRNSCERPLSCGHECMMLCSEPCTIVCKHRDCVKKRSDKEKDPVDEQAARASAMARANDGAPFPPQTNSQSGYRGRGGRGNGRGGGGGRGRPWGRGRSSGFDFVSAVRTPAPTTDEGQQTQAEAPKKTEAEDDW